MRSSWPFLAAALALAGCSSTKENTAYRDVWHLIRTGVAGTFGNVKVTQADAAAVPYASMGWRLKGSNQALIVLATDTGGELMWTSSAHIVLVTRDGRLIRSVGLGYDLGGSTPKGAGMPPPAQALKAPFTSTRVVDYPDIGRYGAQIDCRAHAAARQTINILGHGVATMRVDEDCYSPAFRWRFTDSYWVDIQDGTVWRSRQHFHPRQEEIELVLFRPPG